MARCDDRLDAARYAADTARRAGADQPIPLAEAGRQLRAIADAYARAAQEMFDSFRPVADALREVDLSSVLGRSDAARHRPGDPKW